MIYPLNNLSIASFVTSYSAVGLTLDQIARYQASTGFAKFGGAS